MPKHRSAVVVFAIYAILVVIALAVVGGVLGLLVPDFPGRGELLGTIALVAVYTLAGPVVAVAFRKKRPWIAVACVVPLLVSLAVWLVMIWFNSAIHYRVEEVLIKTGLSGLIVSGAVLFHGLLQLPKLTSRVVRVGRVASVTLAVLAGVITIAAMWIEPMQDDLLWRAVGVLTVLAIGGAFAVFAFAALTRVKHDAQDDSQLAASTLPVALACPRCGEPCDLIANRAGRCPVCKLTLRVEVEEPRCDCGYLLYQLTATACPECGRPIPPEARWGTSNAPPRPPPTSPPAPPDPHRKPPTGGTPG